MTDDNSLSPEAIEFIKESVWKNGRLMAIMVKSVYEKWGREAIDVLCKSFYDFGIEEGKRYKCMAGYAGRENEIDVAVALKDFYAKYHKDTILAGLCAERTLCAGKYNCHVLKCPVFDAWKSVWDKPWLMCEILSKSFDAGFMYGLNPKLEWVSYPEKDNEKGLARGAKYCNVELILNE
ncbi:MAG: L-2-amino-thiazoline-4-carboxylic acid hydrolase [Gammaproteobacteria bacterium]|nr:L-2-amino-thiazoline-4-carboxylic acid hydrolase [Gammaproteobacteria bacterium]